MGEKTEHNPTALDAWQFVQAVIVGLVVTQALETIYLQLKAYVQNADVYRVLDINNSIFWSNALMAMVFFSLLARFYLGAFRFKQLSDERPNFAKGVRDFILACALFSVFYFLASSLGDKRAFIFFALSLHVVDSVWFLFASIGGYWGGDKSEPFREIYLPSFFLFLSVASLTVLKCFPPDAALTGLFVIGLYDFYMLKKFYESGEKRFGWS